MQIHLIPFHFQASTKRGKCNPFYIRTVFSMNEIADKVIFAKYRERELDLSLQKWYVELWAHIGGSINVWCFNSTNKT